MVDHGREAARRQFGSGGASQAAADGAHADVLVAVELAADAALGSLMWKTRRFRMPQRWSNSARAASADWRVDMS